jgi:hypothetical protein
MEHEKEKKPKFVQLVAVGAALHALDDEGGVWVLVMGRKRIGSESVLSYDTATWVPIGCDSKGDKP